MRRNLIPPAAAEFRVVTPDRRGYGDRSRPSAGPDDIRVKRNGEVFLRHMLRRLPDPVAPEPEGFAEYLRCLESPETIRETRDGYCAGASIGLDHDRADRGKKPQ
ncbi:MAG: hypothetical protein J2P48_22695 [Alphaproteobacteria bacterium]|nr:hypothetical protein [Alphaproteobacteria bacterium]